MAQSFVQLATDGTGKKMDTQVTTTAAQHRQVMSIGDKATDANVAPVDAVKGMAVDLSQTGSFPALPAGTNAIGKLAANSGVDIGDVDVTSISAGDNNIGNVDIVTVPNDPFGVNADVSSATGSISAKLKFLAAGIAGATSLPAGANNIGDVDVLTLPALVAGTANIGDVDVLTLPALPAGTNNIGDVDVLTVPADPFGVNADAGSATGSISAKLRFIAGTGIPITGTVTVGSHPVTNAGTFAVQATTLAHGKTVLSTGGSAASSGNNTLVAAGTNKLKVHAFSLTTVSTTAVTCIFQSGAGGTELWRVVLQAVTGASTGANLAVSVPAHLFATASATLLNLNLSSANAIHWSLSYIDES